MLTRVFAARQMASSPAMSALGRVREMGRAIMQMAEEQMAFERRLTVTETRMDKAAGIVVI
ncbi:MAG: hypothetical protein KC418_06130 [Anaerolineales bacterium]|nr:hypothetical protein [Anaerolineales bacterium]